jgi:hypothetical protein
MVTLLAARRWRSAAEGIAPCRRAEPWPASLAAWCGKARDYSGGARKVNGIAEFPPESAHGRGRIASRCKKPAFSGIRGLLIRLQSR